MKDVRCFYKIFSFKIKNTPFFQEKGKIFKHGFNTCFLFSDYQYEDIYGHSVDDDYGTSPSVGKNSIFYTFVSGY